MIQEGDDEWLMCSDTRGSGVGQFEDNDPEFSCKDREKWRKRRRQAAFERDTIRILHMCESNVNPTLDGVRVERIQKYTTEYL